MVLDRDGRICYACGQEANEVDHIWPRAKGGDMFDPLNCAAICRACNLAKGDRFFSPTPTPPVFHPQVVCGINPAFAGLSPATGYVPMYYSPVRHSPAPEGPLPFDLHV